MNNRNLQEWKYIPTNAFLYFPSNDAIRSGNKQKAWRKIFQNGQQYDPFEIKALEDLNAEIKKNKIEMDNWFTVANKLRFLQANKFNVKDTVKSIVEANKWRKKDFPVKITAKLTQKLNSGCFYFCGRDNLYRPILVCNPEKVKSDQVDLIPNILMIILEFMLDELLIEGQVQNYVLIIDLSADIQIGTVKKIVNFTSNTYRSRLFASYLLGVPTWLDWGWNGIASGFVSENTLKKIKLSKKLVHEDMWSHIDPSVIEVKYGGRRNNFQSHLWPPPHQILANSHKDPNLPLLTQQQYNTKNKQKELLNRKIAKNLIKQEKVEKKTELQSMKESKNIQDQAKSDTSIIEGGRQNFLTQAIIQQEMNPRILQRQFSLFFEDREFMLAVGLEEIWEIGQEKLNQF